MTLPWVRERVEIELVATGDREKVFKVLYEEESEIRSIQKIIIKGSEGDGTLSDVGKAYYQKASPFNLIKWEIF